jgi:transcriptional regulator with XRE-family HTH domain
VGSGEKSEWAVQIRHLRASLGMSQGAFAQLFIGRGGEPLDSQSVSNWERGQNKPSPANYIKMGNLAPGDDQRLWFWGQAGIDLSLIPRAARRVIAAQHSKRKIG